MNAFRLKFTPIYILSLFSVVCVSAQQLSLDSLVNRALEVNYDVIMAKEQSDLAQSNITVYQFLPSLSASLRQNQAGGTSNTTNTLGASAQLGWRLFDGLAMFNLRKRQEGQYDLSLIKQRAITENIITQVLTQYYLIVSLENRVNVAEESVVLSQLRYNEAKLKYDIGSASGLEKELARTDYNTDSSTLITHRQSLDIAYIQLNSMLRYQTEQRGYVNDTIQLIDELDKETMEQNALERNSLIIAAKQGLELSDLSLKITQASRYPTLDFGTGYNYGFSDAGNPRGSLNSSQGFNWGFTVGVNIFNGLKLNSDIGSARIEKQIAQTVIDKTSLEVETEMERLWTNYTTNLRLIHFETQNAQSMRFNLQTAMQRYRLGDLSGIDLRIIQQQYLTSEDRKINVIYQAKASEILLLKLSGIII